ncbi:MAG: hypothetical protein OXN94_05435 [Chloroflexota bacterium]|nr:hypothetical protein [Chloroflexota bacterium]
MNDRRVRQLVIAILGVILVLGLLSLVSTVFQMIVPLGILAIGAFAFYKIVLEGRDKPAAMEDELAESTGIAADEDLAVSASDDARVNSEAAAQERLSAVEQAQSEFLENPSPAEEILDQINERRQRLQGDEDE